MATRRRGLDRHKIIAIKKLFLEKYGLPLQLVNEQGVPVGVTEADRVSRPLCALLSGNPAACACCQLDHRRAIETAFALGDSYSYVCHAGLLVNCTPLLNGSERLGALLSGQTLPESCSAALVEETQQRLSAFGLEEDALSAAVKDHLFVPGNVLQKAGAFVLQLVRSVLELDTRALTEQREQAQQQSQIAETIREIKQRIKTANVPYPYEREKELLQRVKDGDRVGAKAVLNQILGAIMFRDAPGSPLFKTRLVELLALVSRAAADSEEGGAGAAHDWLPAGETRINVEKVLERNLVNIGKLLRSDDHTELCVTISKALNEFLDIACARREARIENPVAAIAAYMEANHDRMLSVDELARQAHLSVSRASHLFKQHYGVSMIELLTRIRIEHAKKLLLETNLSCLEIALSVGYQEQAYFTRMFRQQEHITPRSFRVMNRRAP